MLVGLLMLYIKIKKLINIKESKDMKVYNLIEKRDGILKIVDNHFEVESEGYFTVIYRTLSALYNSGWEIK